MDRGTLDQLRLLLRPLVARIANIAARGTVKFVKDSAKQQLVQLGVLDGETIDDAEHFQPYGFSSVPLGGGEAVVIFPNGDRSHPLVVAVADRRYRPTGGEPGEVIVYNNTGAKIRLTKDGDVIAEPAPGRDMLVRSPGGTAKELAYKSDVEAVDNKYAAHLHSAAGAATSGPLSAYVPGPPPVATPLAPAAVVGTTVLKGE